MFAWCVLGLGEGFLWLAWAFCGFGEGLFWNIIPFLFRQEKTFLPLAIHEEGSLGGKVVKSVSLSSKFRCLTPEYE